VADPPVETRIVRVRGPKVTIVQEQTTCSRTKAIPAGVGSEASSEGLSWRVWAERSGNRHKNPPRPANTSVYPHPR
jgi:hypothetical protein